MDEASSWLREQMALPCSLKAPEAGELKRMQRAAMIRAAVERLGMRFRCSERAVEVLK